MFLHLQEHLHLQVLFFHLLKFMYLELVEVLAAVAVGLVLQIIQSRLEAVEVEEVEQTLFLELLLPLEFL